MIPRERTGLVRKSARVLTAFANATVPVMTVVLRKAYGLGYYIMGSRALDPIELARRFDIERGAAQRAVLRDHARQDLYELRIANELRER